MPNLIWALKRAPTKSLVWRDAASWDARLGWAARVRALATRGPPQPSAPGQRTAAAHQPRLRRALYQGRGPDLDAHTLDAHTLLMLTPLMLTPYALMLTPCCSHPILLLDQGRGPDRDRARRHGSMVKVPSLGSARGRPPRLLRARLTALAGAALHGERPVHWAPSHRLGCSSLPPPKPPISAPLTIQAWAARRSGSCRWTS